MTQSSRRFRNCLRHLGKEDLVDFYNITTPISIRFKRQGNSCTITFAHESPPVYVGFEDLPKDINRHIMEYGGTRFRMQIHIAPPEDYPFNPCIWTIKELVNNIQSELNVVEHMDYLVDTHVAVYHRNKNWSPAITIEKDILSFIVRLLPCLDLLIEPFPT